MAIMTTDEKIDLLMEIAVIKTSPRIGNESRALANRYDELIGKLRAQFPNDALCLIGYCSTPEEAAQQWRDEA